MIIGIAGGSGSGKTTLTQKLKAYFQEDITVILQDDYYRCLDQLSFLERQKVNYDHPDAIDMDLLISHIKELKKGHSIEMPIYDFTKHTRKKDIIKIKPTKVIIVEGILIFHNETLRNLFDLKIYVDLDADERLSRRIMRDIKERNRSLEDVIEQYLTSVKVMHERFVEPTKSMADLVICGKNNDEAIANIKRKIEEKL